VPEGPRDDRPETGSGETSESPGNAGSAGTPTSPGDAGSRDKVEARLREALSRAAPKGYPTIGVRESVVEAVRARHRQKQRVGLSVAACCALIAGTAVAVTTVDVGKSQPSISAAAGPVGQTNGGRSPVAKGVAPSASGAALAARCAVVTVGAGSNYGCSGVFSTLPGGTYGAATFSGSRKEDLSNPPAPSATSMSPSSGAVNSGNTTTTSAPGPLATEGGTANTTDEIVVPVGRPVTVTLPGASGEIWTSPAVESGQGQEATAVRTTSATAGIPGNGSSATFESAVPGNIVVIASELAVCGPLQAVCGTPTETWSVVLEFRKF
jgi:hypothetical protein